MKKSKVRIDPKKMPPLKLTQIVRGIVFIILLVGLSITASKLAVPRMIAYTLSTGKFTSVTSPELRAAAQFIQLLPAITRSAGIKDEDALNAIMSLDPDSILESREQIVKARLFEPRDAAKVFFTENNLKAFDRREVYAAIASAADRQKIMVICAAVESNKFSMNTYIKAGKIIAKQSYK